MFKRLWHKLADFMLNMRVEGIVINCDRCFFDPRSGMVIACDTHYDRIFDLEGRAEEHYDHYKK